MITIAGYNYIKHYGAYVPNAMFLNNDIWKTKLYVISKVLQYGY